MRIESVSAPMERSYQNLLLGALLAALTVGACNCDEQTLIPIVAGTCEPDFACPTGYEYRRGLCVVARCQIDSECCPGQKCIAGAGFCGDQWVACTDDSQCGEVPGQTCIDFRDGKYCGYPNKGNARTSVGTQTCFTNADCDDGRSCFGKRCVIYAPCNGGCPSGQVCDVDSNTCTEVADCTDQCSEGQMLVVSDPDTMSGPLCCLVKCGCETLPPVLAGQYGWYASLAANNDQVAVSAYDPVYGDLVVARYDATGNQTRVDYVDGFPTTGPIVANPSGPRGGRSEPGPNVGEHTSVAIDGTGAIHVAYYDRTDGRLRYARSTATGWETSIVDENGDVGLYTSIAIGPNGPAIAYLMAEGLVSPDPVNRTGLKLAQARTPTPSSPSDWDVVVVDSRPKPEPICGGGCSAGNACVDLGAGAGPVCTPEASACTETCASDEVCVMDTAGPTCSAKISVVPLDDLLPATGLFADLAFTSTGTPVIAYYDRIVGDLRLAKGDGAGGFILRTLDGNDPVSPTDVGQHVSLAIGPNDQIAVAYFDATKDDLVYLDVSTNTKEIVDNGVTPPNLRLVGADASLIFDANGDPAIAYQDPTEIDLLYARRTGSPAMWWSEVLRGQPAGGATTGLASGFYASQARRGDQAFISNVDVTFDTESNLLLELMVVVKPL